MGQLRELRQDALDAVDRVELPDDCRVTLRHRISHCAVVHASWTYLQTKLWVPQAEAIAILTAALVTPALAALVALASSGPLSWLFTYGSSWVILAIRLLYRRLHPSFKPWWTLEGDHWWKYRAILLAASLIAIRSMAWHQVWLVAVVAVAAYTFMPQVQLLAVRAILPQSARIPWFRAPDDWPCWPTDMLLWRLFQLLVHAEIAEHEVKHRIQSIDFAGIVPVRRINAPGTWCFGARKRPFWLGRVVLAADVVLDEQDVVFDEQFVRNPRVPRLRLAKNLEGVARWCDTELIATGRHVAAGTASLVALGDLGRHVAAALRVLRDSVVIDMSEPTLRGVTDRLRTLVLACAAGTLSSEVADVELPTTPQRLRQLARRLLPGLFLVAAAIAVPLLLDLSEAQATPVRVTLIVAAVLALLHADKDTTDRILGQIKPPDKPA